MSDTKMRKPPLPLLQTFLTCREIFRDPKKRTAILIGPASHIPVNGFPAHVRMSIFTEFTGGHGSYVPRLSLSDSAGEVVWGWTAPGPFELSDPLLPRDVAINDLMVAVPMPGRFSLTLFLNEGEMAQRTLWFGPTEGFRRSDPQKP